MRTPSAFKTVEQLMTTEVVTLTREASVATAIQTLLRHRLGVLPILDAGSLVGTVSAHDLLGQPLYRTVGDIMPTDLLTVSPDTPIAEAYHLMETRGIERLVVVRDSRAVGIITLRDITSEIGKLTDPLTNLAWPSLLRQCGEDLLHDGQEAVVIFVDLDHVREVNKRLGHVIGDHVIAAVAGVLQSRIDSELDQLCRYGGDEFAVVTARPAADACALAERLLEGIQGLRLPQLAGMAVSAAIGLAGGRRRGSRPDAYSRATIDDLITLARRACARAKGVASRIFHIEAAETAEATRAAVVDVQSSAPPAATIGEPTAIGPQVEAQASAIQPRRIVLHRTELEVVGRVATATVELAYGNHHVVGKAVGRSMAEHRLTAVAEATARGLNELLPPGTGVVFRALRILSVDGQAVLADLHILSPTTERRVLGAVPAGEDAVADAAMSVLHAVNGALEPLVIEAHRPASQIPEAVT